MRRIVLRSTPRTRSISRWDLPASSRVWTEIRKFGFKTFTPGPFSAEKGHSVTSRRRSLARRRPASIYGIRVEEFDPPTGGGSWVPAGVWGFAPGHRAFRG